MEKISDCRNYISYWRQRKNAFCNNDDTIRENFDKATELLEAQIRNWTVAS